MNIELRIIYFLKNSKNLQNNEKPSQNRNRQKRHSRQHEADIFCIIVAFECCDRLIDSVEVFEALKLEAGAIKVVSKQPIISWQGRQLKMTAIFGKYIHFDQVLLQLRIADLIFLIGLKRVLAHDNKQRHQDNIDQYWTAQKRVRIQIFNIKQRFFIIAVVNESPRVEADRVRIADEHESGEDINRCLRIAGHAF